MPGKVYDVIVVGLGAMGSAAVYHLAADGKRVDPEYRVLRRRERTR